MLRVNKDSVLFGRMTKDQEYDYEAFVLLAPVTHSVTSTSNAAIECANLSQTKYLDHDAIELLRYVQAVYNHDAAIDEHLRSNDAAMVIFSYSHTVCTQFLTMHY